VKDFYSFVILSFCNWSSEFESGPFSSLGPWRSY